MPQQATLIKPGRPDSKRVVDLPNPEFNQGETLMTPALEAESARMSKSFGTLGPISNEAPLGRAGDDFLTKDSDSVKNFMGEYPGVSVDAAIGSVLNKNRNLAAGKTLADPTIKSGINGQSGGGAVGVSGGDFNLGGLNLGNLNFGSYGINGGDFPQYEAPDTSAYDATIKGAIGELGDYSGIDRGLETAKNAIYQKYADERAQAMRSMANQQAAESGDLAGVGFNPLSSGQKSLKSSADSMLTRHLQQLEIAKAAELAAVEDRYYGRKNDSLKSVLDNTKSERARLEEQASQDYTRRVNEITSKINNLNSIIGIVREQKNISNADKNAARGDITSLFDALGSKAFSGSESSDLRSLEEASGLPYGTIKQMQSYYKEQEMKAEQPEPVMPELRSVDGSVYQFTYNPETGQYEPKMLAGGGGLAGGGISGGYSYGGGSNLGGGSSGLKSGGSVSWRHNNPLNIKFGNFASGYGATQGQQATDGGAFASFPTVEAGLQAAKDLLRAPSYANLSLEQAMRRWSGNGYGADVAPHLAGKTTGQMSDAELQQLVEAMTQREGWTEGTAAGGQSGQGMSPQQVEDAIKKYPAGFKRYIDYVLTKTPTFKLTPDMLPGMYEQYSVMGWPYKGKGKQTEETGGEDAGPPEFTNTEIKKLEQAGIDPADRQKSLDYLYGKNTGEEDREILEWLNKQQ